MATIRLVPSTYAVSNSSYVTVTSPSNMYNNTDHTSNYASIKGRNSSSNTYYCYVRGFNFDDVPSNATVSAFSVKIRAYRNSYLSTSSSYYLRLCNGTSAISNTTLSSALTTTSTVYTFPTSSLSWSTIKNYGSNFGIYIPLRRGSSSGTPYVYVYGVEIEVTYTLPTPYTISVTGASPAGSNTVYEGDSFTVYATTSQYPEKPVVTDNDVDVTSSVTQSSNQWQYILTNISANHTIVFEEAASEYIITVTGASPSGQTTVQKRDSFTATNYAARCPTVLDNGVDVTSSVVQGSSSPTRTTSTPAGTYAFISNSGTYTLPTLTQGDVAYTDFTITLNGYCNYSVYVDVYTQPGDYALLSNINTSLSADTNVDSSDKTRFKIGSSSGGWSTQDYVYYMLTPGTYHIYAKFIKLGSEMGTRKFTLTLSGTETSFTYTIASVTAAHTLVFTDPPHELYLKTSSASETSVINCYYFDN